MDIKCFRIRRDVRHSRIFLSICLTSLLLLCMPESANSESANSQRVQERLRQRIEAAGYPPVLAVGDELIHASITLPHFYERRAFQPAWVTDEGPRQYVSDLIRAISRASDEGLLASDYHMETITALLEQTSTSKQGKLPYSGELVDLELLCTDAFLIYGSHLLLGRINPETVDAEWFANRREADLADVLESGLADGSIRSALESLLPRAREYHLLKKALDRYRAVAEEGGWASVPDGPKLREGDSGERVAALRNRLRLSGDIDAEPPVVDTLFDESLHSGVVQFQSRHGLETDGVVGSATLAALNTTAQERVRQLITNLERWRWLPQELEERYILINIADFKLNVVEFDTVAISMPVIVGRSYRRTPVFSDRMTYLVMNPYWHVPPSLAALDILPAVRKDSAYLTDNGFDVFLGWGAEAVPLNPAEIDWSKVTGKNLRYRFRQKPGPKNALGRVKFMFPNQFNVYLHDTPAKGLFAKSKRDFSSGCIRIAKPIELMEYLLELDPGWNSARIDSLLNISGEQTVRLPTGVPIHILYWTAWSDEDGTINFREDIYDRDRPLWEALSEEPPGFN